MLAVAGNPRSGTSLMMRCFAEAVGVDRIIGDKFPQLTRQTAALEQQEGESDQHYQTRLYITNKYPENSDEVAAQVVDMNPNGFWECPFTVRGIRYRPAHAELLEHIKTETTNVPFIIKLVNSGLYSSDPSYVSKVLYMLRHPRNIAKSQERLRRSQKFTLLDGREVDLYEGVKVHNPQFYLQSTTQFAKWRLEHPTTPLLYVPYDSLVENPVEELNRIADFSGIEALSASADIINPRLRRSKQEPEIESDMWEQAEAVHECLLEQDYQGIVDITADPKGNFAKSTLTFLCLRLRAAVNYHNCVACRQQQDKDFIASGIRRAQANGWDWWKEPCTFECGFDPDDEDPMSISESVAHNHWLRQL